MKNYKSTWVGRIGLLIVLLGGLLFAMTPTTVLAAACTSTGSGNWGTSGTWSCGRVPLFGDSVTIQNGHTVTLNVNAPVLTSRSLTSLTINGSLQTSGAARTLNASVIDVNGSFDMSVGGTNMNVLLGSTGTGTLTVAGGGELKLGATTFSLNGNFANSGTFDSGTSTFAFTGTSTTKTSNAASFNNLSVTGGTLTLAAGTTVNGALNVTSGGTLDASAVAFDVLGALNVGSGSTLTVSQFPASPSSVGLNAASTVEYKNAGAHNIAQVAYGGLKISGPGAASLLSGATNIAGRLDISSGSLDLIAGSSFNLNGSNQTFAMAGGSLYVSDSANFPDGFGTYSFSGGTVVYQYNGAVSISNSPMKDGSSGYSGLTVTGGGTKTIAYAASGGYSRNDFIVQGNLWIDVGTLDYGTSNINIGGNLTQDAGTTFAGTEDINNRGLTAVVTFYGAALTQTIDTDGTVTFYTLYVNKSAGKVSVINNDVTVYTLAEVFSGVLEMLSGTILSVNDVNTDTILLVDAAGTLAIGGSEVFPAISNSFILFETGSTVDYRGGAQTVAAAPPYENLTISGTLTKTLENAISVNGTLNVSAGALDLLSYTVSAGPSANLVVAAGATLRLSGNNFPAGFNTATSALAQTSTVDYNGAGAQSVSTTPLTWSTTFVQTRTADPVAGYGNLTLSGGGTKTIAGSLDIGGNLTIASGVTLADGGGAYTVQLWGTTTTTAFENNGTLNLTGSLFQLVADADLRGVDATDPTGFSFHDLRIPDGITLTATAAVPLNVSGFWEIGPTAVFTPLAGTVNFNGAGDQLISGATTFYNLSVTNTAGTPSDSADVHSDAAVTVSSTLAVNDGQFRPFTGSAFKDVSIAADGIFKPAASAAITVSGAWSDSGTFTANSGTVTFNGSASQALTGVSTFYNLSVANTAGTPSDTADVSGEVIVTNTLTVSDGQFRPLIDSAFKDVNISAVSGTLKPDASAMISVSGSWNNSGNFLANLGMVIFNGSSAQDLSGPTTFYTLIITNTSEPPSDTGDVRSSAPVTVENALYIFFGQFRPSSASSFQDVNIGTNGIFKPAATAFIVVRGLWDNDGSFVDNSGTVMFSGNSAQALGGNNPTTFHNLTILNGSGVNQSSAVTVNNALDLATGRLTLAANDLTLPVGASVVGTPGTTKMVVTSGAGKFCKGYSGIGTFTYPLGDATGTVEYTPGVINFTSGSFAAAQACMSVKNAKFSALPGSMANYLDRYWELTQTGITGFSANLNFNYMPADVVGDDTKMFIWKYDTAISAWKHPNLGALNTATHQMQPTVSSFSVFTAAYDLNPTAVDLVNFKTLKASAGGAAILWETVDESHTLGFNIYRSEAPAGPYVKLNNALIPAEAAPSPAGWQYTYQDITAGSGKVYYYKLEAIGSDLQPLYMAQVIYLPYQVFVGVIR